MHESKKQSNNTKASRPQNRERVKLLWVIDQWREKGGGAVGVVRREIAHTMYSISQVKYNINKKKNKKNLNYTIKTKRERNISAYQHINKKHINL